MTTLAGEKLTYLGYLLDIVRVYVLMSSTLALVYSDIPCFTRSVGYPYILDGTEAGKRPVAKGTSTFNLLERSLHKKRAFPMLSFLSVFAIPSWCRSIPALLSIGTVVVCSSVCPSSASQEIAHYAFAPERSSQFAAVLGLLLRVWSGKMWQGSPLSNLPGRFERTMTKATVAASETPSTQPATGTVSESCLSLSEIHAVKRAVQVRSIHIEGLAETC